MTCISREGMYAMVQENQWLTIHELAEKVGNNKSLSHMTDGKTQHASSCYKICSISADQWTKRKTCSNLKIFLISQIRMLASSMRNVITGDETWAYSYNIKAKTQSLSGWGRYRQDWKKSCKNRWIMKMMLFVFFDWIGVTCKYIHMYLFVDQTSTESFLMYCGIWGRQLPQALTNKTWMLHYDSAPAHSFFVIWDFFVKNNTIIVSQPPPYSPDSAPTDFFLFPWMKAACKDGISRQ